MAERTDLTEREVVDTMKSWQEAFENGDQRFFNFFSEDMTIFALSTPTRIDSLETYQHGFAPVFSVATRKSQILSPEVRLLGPDSAVMTFHNRILIHGVSTNIRGTVIFARDRSGTLKCVHMHNSPLTAPPVQPAPPQNIDDVTLLEERVASAVAMVGTPK